MCRLAEVSRAGYYRRWRQLAPRREQAELRNEIQNLALNDRPCRHYGYRRITAELRRRGWCVNHKRVLRLMRTDNLLCLRRKGFVVATTDSNHRFRIYPNLARKLEPTGINQLWVSDITYVRLAESFVFLAIILDAYSRRVVGWAMETHLQAILALKALEMALSTREVIPGTLVHHSDRGVQYACGDYIARLEAHEILPSMSRVACPYDNAMAESFIKTLKTEQVEGQAYRDLDHARDEIGSFIEQVYNRQRLHSALGYRPPVEFEDTDPAPLPGLRQAGALNTNCP